MINNGIAMTKNRAVWMPSNRTTPAVVPIPVITRASINRITNMATRSTMIPAAWVTNMTTSVLPITDAKGLYKLKSGSFTKLF